jgi:hypothetical protein
MKPENSVMTFKLSQATTGLLRGLATVTVFEDPPSGASAGKPKMVQVQFPFMIPASEADDLKKMVTEAKRLLQEAINDREGSCCLEAPEVRSAPPT